MPLPADGDRWHVLRRLDPGEIEYLADDMDEALAGGHVQRGLHLLVEVVGAAVVGVQQRQRDGGLAVPHRLVQRVVALPVGHHQGALEQRVLRVELVRPGPREADEQLRHVQPAHLGG
jgi:hypothetical protein